MNNYVPNELRDLTKSQERIIQNVINHFENKNSYKPKRKWQYSLITVILSVVVLFFIINQFNTPSNDQASNVEIPILVSNVTEVWIARATSETSFKANLMSNMNTIRINDPTFQKEVERLFKNLKLSSTIPAYTEPAYDVNISQKNSDPFKVKIWEVNGVIYLYDLDEKTYYTTTHESGINVYLMINNIPHPD